MKEYPITGPSIYSNCFGKNDVVFNITLFTNFKLQENELRHHQQTVYRKYRFTITDHSLNSYLSS
jgi:hypothetical protein